MTIGLGIFGDTTRDVSREFYPAETFALHRANLPPKIVAGLSPTRNPVVGERRTGKARFFFFFYRLQITTDFEYNLYVNDSVNVFV